MSADLDTRGIDFNQSNWYEQIPPRQRLRIASDITSYRRAGYGGIFEKVCELFKQRAQNTPSNLPWITLLERERDQLKIQCHNLPSPIPHPIRRRGNAIIESSEENLQTQIQAFMAEEFEHREELYQRIREQAEAEGVTIEASDREWAQNHALENIHRFVQGLARWLDNN